MRVLIFDIREDLFEAFESNQTSNIQDSHLFPHFLRDIRIHKPYSNADGTCDQSRTSHHLSIS